MKKIIILIGAPGSGKGTQAKLIAEKFHYAHISTGDLLRALAGDDSADPKLATVLANMKKGELVPDWLIFQLAFAAINERLSKGQGVVLDGAIRNLYQARAYQEYFTKIGLTEKDILAIEVKISERESMSRLTKRRVCSGCGEIIPWSETTKDINICHQCGGELVIRLDDNLNTIKARIAEQGDKILRPLTAYYDKLGVLAKVDGMRGIEEVWRQVELVLKK